MTHISDPTKPSADRKTDNKTSTGHLNVHVLQLGAHMSRETKRTSMPYIEYDDTRAALDTLANNPIIDTLDVGDLNYLITALCDRFSVRNEGFRYAESIHDIIGTLECVKLEWYTRRATLYEDLKRHINGDVAPLSHQAIAKAYQAAHATPEHIETVHKSRLARAGLTQPTQ
jgi:hypothetical protein